MSHAPSRGLGKLMALAGDIFDMLGSICKKRLSEYTSRDAAAPVLETAPVRPHMLASVAATNKCFIVTAEWLPPRRAVRSSAQLLGDNRPASVLKASCTVHELKSLIRPRGFISRRRGSLVFLRYHKHKLKQNGLDVINDDNADEDIIIFVVFYLYAYHNNKDMFVLKQELCLLLALASRAISSPKDKLCTVEIPVESHYLMDKYAFDFDTEFSFNKKPV
ncbi:hypothetical protein GQX74_005785 [Glossina fuscipes]|nr:hypothetical protein GQX74_005785 [Glossina fuscipes]